jgi:hypothetical protein
MGEMLSGNKSEKVEPKKEVEREAVDLEGLLCEVSDVSRGRREESRLANPSNLPVLALLPGVQSSLATSPARNLRVSPFKPPHSITMGVAIKEVPANEVNYLSSILTYFPSECVILNKTREMIITMNEK